MNRSPDRIDIHNRKHRFELALRNLKQDPQINPENKTLIQQFVTFCGAANLSVERQLIYLQKLTILARLYQAQFEQATISTACGSYLDAMRTLRFMFELLVQ